MSFYDAIRVGASGAADFEIERSLRYNPADITNLERTFGSASNRRTITFGGGLWTGGNHQYRLLSIPFSYLHSPSSTSAITYSIYKSDSGATSTYINRSQQDGDNTDRTRGISTITLMEIAG